MKTLSLRRLGEQRRPVSGRLEQVLHRFFAEHANLNASIVRQFVPAETFVPCQSAFLTLRSGERQHRGRPGSLWGKLEGHVDLDAVGYSADGFAQFGWD